MTVDTAWTPPGLGSWPRRPVRSDVMWEAAALGADCRPRVLDWTYSNDGPNCNLNSENVKKNMT